MNQVDYIFKSSRGAKVMSFTNEEDAWKWLEKRNQNPKAPALFLFKVTRIEEQVHAPRKAD